MYFEFDNNSPIYLQICEQIKLKIISGALLPGERLPSVRELAIQLKVNPNTLQKALAELEDIGLIYTERTNGKFVTESTELIDSQRTAYADHIARKFLSSMAHIGFSLEDAVDHLKKRKEDNNGND